MNAGVAVAAAAAAAAAAAVFEAVVVVSNAEFVNVVAATCVAT